MTQPKFFIRKKIIEKPGDTYRNTLYKMCIAAGCSTVSAERWMRIKLGEKRGIPMETFYKIANFFDCNPQDLINNG